MHNTILPRSLLYTASTSSSLLFPLSLSYTLRIYYRLAIFLSLAGLRFSSTLAPTSPLSFLDFRGSWERGRESESRSRHRSDFSLPEEEMRTRESISSYLAHARSFARIFCARCVFFQFLNSLANLLRAVPARLAAGLNPLNAGKK